ncbi:hypothetical protein II906_02485 [bacterium]|nr:hypothetical protein [bacterium]
MLIAQKNKFVLDLFKMFDIPFEESDFNTTTVETQCEYWVEEYKHWARPDIQITIKNINVDNIYFIECKVDSDLNQYKKFDQIQLYEKIPNTKPEIRTLTKYDFSTTSSIFKEKHKVFWYQLFELFKQYNFQNDILIRNFLTFLEENNMGEKKLLVMKPGGLDNYYSLYSFLYENISDFAKRCNYSTVKFKDEEDSFGFDIYYKNPIVWIGCYRAQPDYIVVQSYIDSEELRNALPKTIKSEKYIIDPIHNVPIFAKKAIIDFLNVPTVKEQITIFKDWVNNSSINKILDISRDLAKKQIKHKI